MIIQAITQKDVHKRIQVRGRINNIRFSKQIIFIEISDVSIFKTLQVLVFCQNKKFFLKCEKLKFHDFIEIRGTIQDRHGVLELHADSILPLVPIQDADYQYQLQPKKQSPTFLRSHESIRLRVKLYQAIFEIRLGIISAFHNFLAAENFIAITAPIITPFDAEGAGETFSLVASNVFFGQKAFLTVSSQFYAESMAQTFSYVYVFGPIFRADLSKTTRHAAEFWMLEPEWVTNKLDDILDLSEKIIRFAASEVLKKFSKQLKYCELFYQLDLQSRLRTMVEKDFVRINYRQAIADLNKFYSSHQDKKYDPIIFGDKITKQDELTLCDNIYHNGVFVTNYPLAQKAFYMLVAEDDETVLCVDLLLPEIGEVLGGSLRANNFVNLVTQINQRKLDKTSLSWYISLRQQKYAPTGGFGLGLARLVMYFTGATNIKDVIAFPRLKNHLHF